MKLINILAAIILVSVSNFAHADRAAVSVGIYGPNGAVTYSNGGGYGYGQGHRPPPGHGYHNHHHGYGRVVVIPYYPPRAYYPPAYVVPQYVAPQTVYIQTPTTVVEQSRFTWVTPESNNGDLECNSRVSRICTGNTCVICK